MNINEHPFELESLDYARVHKLAVEFIPNMIGDRGVSNINHDLKSESRKYPWLHSLSFPFIPILCNVIHQTITLMYINEHPFELESLGYARVHELAVELIPNMVGDRGVSNINHDLKSE